MLENSMALLIILKSPSVTICYGTYYFYYLTSVTGPEQLTSEVSVARSTQSTHQTPLADYSLHND